jgi:uncharacterized sulfatase
MEKSKVGSLNSSSVFAAIDLPPSLAALAGVKSPEGLDGEDLSATFTGKQTASHRSPIFWRRPPEKKIWLPALAVPQPDLAVREGDWKLLCEYDGSKPFLYDLAKDAGETHNLAANEPAVTERLTAAVLAWHQSLPADNGPQLGVQSAKGGAKKK